MKNKHLVLLFLGVFAVGLLARYLPVHYRSIFQAELIRVDTAAMTQCVIAAPGQPELALERSETGWTADQDGRVAPVSARDMDTLLHTLAGISNLRVVKTARPDTLGFDPARQLAVRIYQDKRLIEYFELGSEVLDGDRPATYLKLPLHKGIYLVPGHLRGIFARGLDDFRPRTVVDFLPETLRRFGWTLPRDSVALHFEKNDSTQRWQAAETRYSLSNDSVQAWLRGFSRLNDSAFADQFDESAARQTLIATIALELPGGSAQTLQFFHLKPPELPEDLSQLRRQQVHALPEYVFHSSLNPANYFAVADTNLVRLLCYGPGLNRKPGDGATIQ